MQEICDDLAAEHSALDEVVARLPDPAWDTPTPAPGWSVRDQIGHLAYFDGTARLAATDPDAFATSVAALRVSPGEDPSVATGRALAPAGLLDAWRAGRAAVLAVLRALDPGQRIPWYGPSMSARSFATARLMETWAHGQDVRDALGAAPSASARLRHVAHIGVRARPFSYAVHGQPVPPGDVRVELSAPDGERWSWGSSETDVVEGPALDFCLVVTQRRHPADTALGVRGPAARQWIDIAQAFAGPPGPGRQPGQFAAGASA